MNFENIREEFLEDLKKVIAINSINGNNGAVTKEAPLGEGVYNALEAFLEIGRRFGFTAVNLDGYAGYIECGEGEKTVGIIAHVDTVDVGDGWNYPSLSCTVTEEGVYGRGVADDKGPALLALYAMRDAIEKGLLKDKKVRLILGGDEESGKWECIDRYKKTEKMPDIAFSPDAEYPVVFGEKGLLKVKISGKETAMPEDFNFEGGKVINIVPDKAKAFIDGKELAETGIAAHGSLPELGENAIVKLAEKIAADYPDSTFAKLVSLTTKTALGIDIKDEHGALSLNPSILRADKDSCALSYDIRYPITAEGKTVIDAITKAAEEKGLTAEFMSHDEPLYIPLDSHLIKTLSAVYTEETGDPQGAVSIGGGTYAKAFPNCAAFGVILPGEPETAHQANEFWGFDSIKTNCRIIAKAIERL